MEYFGIRRYIYTKKRSVARPIFSNLSSNFKNSGTENLLCQIYEIERKKKKILLIFQIKFFTFQILHFGTLEYFFSSSSFFFSCKAYAKKLISSNLRESIYRSTRFSGSLKQELAFKKIFLRRAVRV